MRINLAGTLLSLLVSACASPLQQAHQLSSYQPAVDFQIWRNAVTGPLTQVAVLGSPHLSQEAVQVTPETLEPLLDKLAKFNPTLITYEGLSGEQCELVQRHEKIYPGIYDYYCWGVEDGTKATGLTLPEARAAVEEKLKSWPAHPNPAQRRQLAALFIASGERPSASVQWLQLPVSERKQGDGIDSALIDILSRVGKKPNETYEIAVALAARLGLTRVYAVDDHTSDAVLAAAPDGYEAAINAHWAGLSAKSVPELQELPKISRRLTTGEGVLAAYRFYNLPQTQRALIGTDFKDALALPSHELYGRRYVAWFEVRNLRMAANIRAVFANQPGGRVLNVVGASHKAYYEAYLNLMPEVALVDIATILR
ncbi:DUF5694 domain-containing protein [Candidatus Phycosocius spiralis]|uniref:Haem-binding uptake Tiki superfamily ChaN domain-containing protein n=1 Tax=Candidatus Phycosocius spiralis TaxID=2815099 RepID=A0ABQ4PYM6_9PROT|nr:DUF5694 domain-containing protein [Candidatus Phycosocius spiralis]GIU68112.1 hypothetical protein PsB1_2266 [Candidatus Phycosocius spiralis]